MPLPLAPLLSLLSLLFLLSPLIAPARAYSSFDTVCKQRFFDQHNTTGLVDLDGRPTTNLSLARGVTWSACRAVCGEGHQKFNLQKFTISFVTWLLPWLALVTQIPYTFPRRNPRPHYSEAAPQPVSRIIPSKRLHRYLQCTIDSTARVLVCAPIFLLPLGAPEVVLTSLFVTLLAGLDVRRRFRGLRGRVEDIPNTRAQGMKERLEAVEEVLVRGLELPLRLPRGGANDPLPALLLLPPESEVEDFWVTISERLKPLTRHATPSLKVQMAVALLAWCLTALTSVLGNFADTTVALQLSSGSMFVWLAGVVGGWVALGVLGGHPGGKNWEGAEGGWYLGFVVGEGGARNQIPMQQPQTPTSIQSHQPQPPDPPPPHSSNFSMAGDESLPGPIFNYARALTSHSLTTTLYSSFDTILNNMSLEQPTTVDGRPWRDDTQSPLRGTPDEIALYCGLSRPNGNGNNDNNGKNISPPLRKVPLWRLALASLLATLVRWGTTLVHWGTTLWRLDLASLFAMLVLWGTTLVRWGTTLWRLALASLLAMLVRWGTTGLALLIAYQTPTRGIGCRSFVYILYGVIATFAWTALIVSSLLSHTHMENFHSASTFTRSLAVFLRLLGKLLASLNAVMLIVSCLLEYSGFYSRCWCDANVISMGQNGVAIMFLTVPELGRLTRWWWAWGIAGLVVVNGGVWLGVVAVVRRSERRS